MKLGHSQAPRVMKGTRIYNPDGSKYIVTRVSGSTVTADRVPTVLELVARTLGTIAAVCRAAYRNARGSVSIAAAKAKAKHRP